MRLQREVSGKSKYGKKPGAVGSLKMAIDNADRMNDDGVNSRARPNLQCSSTMLILTYRE